MLKEKQPKLFNYLFTIKDKKVAMRPFMLDQKTPLVYTSGRFPSKYWHTSVVLPMVPMQENQSMLVFDLRYNVNDLLEKEKTDKDFTWSPIIKEVAFNKCPAIAPIGVLDQESEKGQTGWERIGLTIDQIQENQKALEAQGIDFYIRIRNLFKTKKDAFAKSSDVDAQLYDGFIPDSDKTKMKDVRGRNANELADYHPLFEDPRLSELLLHYKGRNFPNSLDENEQKEWEQYRIARLQAQEQSFVTELENLKDVMDSGVMEDLLLWYQSLASGDYE